MRLKPTAATKPTPRSRVADTPVEETPKLINLQGWLQCVPDGTMERCTNPGQNPMDLFTPSSRYLHSNTLPSSREFLVCMSRDQENAWKKAKSDMGVWRAIQSRHEHTSGLKCCPTALLEVVKLNEVTQVATRERVSRIVW